MNTTKLYYISPKFARQKSLPAYFVANKLLETDKALYVYGHGTTETTRFGVCMNCGRQLTHPVSVELGIGPECGKHYWDWDKVGGYTKENIERLSKKIRQDIKVDCWIPKAAVKDTFKTEEDIKAPASHKMVKHQRKKKSNKPQKKKAKQVKFQSSGQAAIKITFPFNKQTVSQVKTISGRKFHNEGKNNKYWTAPRSVEAVEKLKKFGFELDDKLKTYYSQAKVNTEDLDTDIDIPGLNGQLFDFQKEGVAFVEARDGRALIADEMGLGKTVQALAWLQKHPEKRPAIIVCPSSLKLNWKREAEHWMDEPDIQILNGTKPTQPIVGDVIIINYHILRHWKKKLKEIKPQVLIPDECFPAGTLIDTPNGKIPIEKLNEGDLVYNATGIGEIKNIGKKKSETIVLHLSGGVKIETTWNHPFFTTKGWEIATNLEGEILLNRQSILNIMQGNTIRIKNQDYETNEKTLQAVWRDIQKERPQSKILRSEMHQQFSQQQKEIPKNLPMVRRRIFSRQKRKKVLRDILLSEMEDESARNQTKNTKQTPFKKTFKNRQENARKQSPCGENNIAAYEEKQPNEQPSNRRKSKTNQENQRDLTYLARRKRREWPINRTSKNTIGRIRMGNRSSDKNKAKTKKRPAYQLQGGYRKQEAENSNRNRREKPQFKRNPIKGLKKDDEIKGVRVERIEVQEPRNTKKSQRRTVYNLEVSGHPSYFVEDHLVHNCHYAKNNKAKRTKALKYIAKEVPHLIALTGTPIVNRPIEILNAIRMIDKSVAPDRWHFMQRYCDAKHNGFGWDFSGASNTTELHEKLTSTIMVRRKKKDVLKDLPDKIRSFVPVELNNKREYEKAEQDFINYVQEKTEQEMQQELKDKLGEDLYDKVEINQEKIDKLKQERAEKASNAEALVKVEQLKQLAVKGKLNQAVSWIKDFLEAEGKLVVFCTHKFVVNELMNTFSDIAVKIDGSVSSDDRDSAVQQFQNDQDTKLFIGNIQAAGTGLTLTAASAMAFLELPWTPGEISQAEDRIHRIGQDDTCNYYYLLAEDTIEERVANMLDQKRKILDSVLDGKETDDQSLLSQLMETYK